MGKSFCTIMFANSFNKNSQLAERSKRETSGVVLFLSALILRKGLVHFLNNKINVVVERLFFYTNPFKRL